jgi:Kdo2-lipid IVA lauroyltransferase/acyltransferase
LAQGKWCLTLFEESFVKGVTRMAKARSKVVDFGAYLVLRWCVCIVQALPRELALAFAAGLAWLVHRINRRHRQVARDNLTQAFPGRYSAAELDQLVRAVYRHFCTLFIEIIQLPRYFHANNWRNYVELPRGDVLIRHLVSGRPMMFVTGHFGNWELGGYILGALGFTTYAIARTLDNPYVDYFLRVKFREKSGQRILSKDGDFDRIQEVLARGGVIATLADQDAGQRGMFVEFFGRPASTHKAVALLSLEHQAPLVVIGTTKIGEPMRYAVVVEDVILPEEYADKPDAVRAITQRYTAALERLVRRHPEQYFWLHRRWKHQPVARRKRAAA